MEMTIMGEWCDNILNVKAHSAIAEKQLKEIKHKIKIARDIFGTIIKEIDTEIKDEHIKLFEEKMKTGIYIFQYRNGDQSNLQSLLDSTKEAEMGITSLGDLENFLLENQLANLELGEYVYKNPNVADIPDLKTLHIDTKELLYVDELQYWIEEHSHFCLSYRTYGYHSQIGWLTELSTRYPELHFSHESQYLMSCEYLADIVNGSLIEYRKFEPGQIGWI